MIKLGFPKIQTQELFCQQYWRNTLEKIAAQKIEPPKFKMLSYDIFDVNCDLLNAEGYRKFKKEEIHKMMHSLDLKFKLLPPYWWSRILWRGISEPKLTASIDVHKYYYRCIDLKKGDIIKMKEYPFASDYKQIAMDYITKPYRGILFKIHVPENNKILEINLHNVLQRESQFLCTGNEEVKQGKYQYNLITLRLLPRKINDEKGIWDNIKEIFRK